MVHQCVHVENYVGLDHSTLGRITWAFYAQVQLYLFVWVTATAYLALLGCGLLREFWTLGSGIFVLLLLLYRVLLRLFPLRLSTQNDLLLLQQCVRALKICLTPAHAFLQLIRGWHPKGGLISFLALAASVLAPRNVRGVLGLGWLYVKKWDINSGLRS